MFLGNHPRLNLSVSLRSKNVASYWYNDSSSLHGYNKKIPLFIFYLQLLRSLAYTYINDAVTNNSVASTTLNCLEQMWVSHVKTSYSCSVGSFKLSFTFKFFSVSWFKRQLEREERKATLLWCDTACQVSFCFQCSGKFSRPAQVISVWVLKDRDWQV